MCCVHGPYGTHAPQNVVKVTTGSTALDELLGGGIESRQITEGTVCALQRCTLQRSEACLCPSVRRIQDRQDPTVPHIVCHVTASFRPVSVRNTTSPSLHARHPPDVFRMYSPTEAGAKAKVECMQLRKRLALTNSLAAVIFIDTEGTLCVCDDANVLILRAI